MIFFIVGASGSGKSSCIVSLKQILPDLVVYDFDEIGVPDNPDKIWRQRTTEWWLKIYLNKKDKTRNFCLCGQMVMGEILACPSAKEIGKVNIRLLDVSDSTRIKRLRNINATNANQDTLCWAAWLRMHFIDPQWHQKVVTENAWEDLDFSRWIQLKSWDDLAERLTIDSTQLRIEDVAHKIADWIKSLV